MGQIFHHGRIPLCSTMLLGIPVELLEHEILTILPWSSLVACLLVCRLLRKVASRVVARKHQFILTTKRKLSSDDSLYNFATRTTILMLLFFEEGTSIHLLQWFATCLRYPIFLTMPASTTIRVDATQRSGQKTTLLKSPHHKLLLKAASLAAKGIFCTIHLLLL